jgi:hypothetical protein
MAWRYQAEKQCNDRTPRARFKARHLISPFFCNPISETFYPQKKRLWAYTLKGVFINDLRRPGDHDLSALDPWLCVTAF